MAGFFGDRAIRTATCCRSRLGDLVGRRHFLQRARRRRLAADRPLARSWTIIAPRKPCCAGPTVGAWPAGLPSSFSHARSWPDRERYATQARNGDHHLFAPELDRHGAFRGRGLARQRRSVRPVLLSFSHALPPSRSSGGQALILRPFGGAFGEHAPVRCQAGFVILVLARFLRRHRRDTAMGSHQLL